MYVWYSIIVWKELDNMTQTDELKCYGNSQKILSMNAIVPVA